MDASPQTTSVLSSTSNPDPARQLWIIVCVSFASFMAALDDYVVSVAQPTIAHEFNATTSEVSQVTLVYMVTLVCTLLTFGKLADQIGFKRAFVAGYAVFITGSLLCCVAPNLWVLLVFRCLQGMGASMLSVSGPAIMVRDIDHARKGLAFGINTTAMALGVALGAPLGGIITGLSNWHGVFAVNVPIGLVALILAVRVLVDDSLNTGGRPRFDGAGIFASSVGLVLLLLGLNQGEEIGGWIAAPVLGCFAGAAFLFCAFCWWELRCADPLMDLRILRDRRLLLALLATLGGYMLYGGCNFLLPFLLIYLHGLRPEQVGIVLLAFSLAFVTESPYVGRLSDRI